MSAAVMVPLVGGTIGIIIDLAIGVVFIFWKAPVIFSMRAMLLVFGCTVMTGLVFGYMPTRSATRLDPVMKKSERRFYRRNLRDYRRQRRECLQVLGEPLRKPVEHPLGFHIAKTPCL
jgi:hypothetical protein